MRLSSSRRKEFKRALIDEERNKTKRLDELAASLRLPVYDVRRFSMPMQIKQYLHRCDEILGDGWTVAIRFSRFHDTLPFFRYLGADRAVAVKAAKRFSNLSPHVAVVTPYKIPEWSGTFTISKGRLHLELVSGPHNWITKAAPTDVQLFWCSTNDCGSLQHSEVEVSCRQLLSRTMLDMTRLLFGCGPRALVHTDAIAYAEFHWHSGIGYRFIDCSFSRAWTDG